MSEVKVTGGIPNNDHREIKKLNEQLKKAYGTYTDGRAWFRISWSNAQRETRWGQFREFCGQLFLREYTGVVKDRPKYSWMKDRWVLEKLMFPERAYKYWSPELIGVENGTYEPVWTFDKDGKYQLPIWNAVEKLCYAALWGKKKKQTEADLIDEENKQFDKEVEQNIIILENESPAIATAVNQGSGIYVPHSFER
jgi:hypothetical protein